MSVSETWNLEEKREEIVCTSTMDGFLSTLTHPIAIIPPLQPKTETSTDGRVRTRTVWYTLHAHSPANIRMKRYVVEPQKRITVIDLERKKKGDQSAGLFKMARRRKEEGLRTRKSGNGEQDKGHVPAYGFTRAVCRGIPSCGTKYN